MRVPRPTYGQVRRHEQRNVQIHLTETKLLGELLIFTQLQKISRWKYTRIRKQLWSFNWRKSSISLRAWRQTPKIHDPFETSSSLACRMISLICPDAASSLLARGPRRLNNCPDSQYHGKFIGATYGDLSRPQRQSRACDRDRPGWRPNDVGKRCGDGASAVSKRRQSLRLRPETGGGGAHAAATASRRRRMFRHHRRCHEVRSGEEAGRGVYENIWED